MAVANLEKVPQLNPVKSRHIEAQAYDPATQDLFLQFKGGRLYRYPKVSAELYQDFMASESKGKFFGANIKVEA